MPKELEYYINLKKIMVDADVERDRAFQAYEEMYHNGWELPKELKQRQLIRKVVSADPHDAISTGRRTLTGLEPEIKVFPLANDSKNKKRANEIENNLRWQLKCANRRRSQSIEADMALSALIYSEVVAQVVDLDYQIAQMKLWEGNTRRLEAARRFGRFMVNTYCPRLVHARYSNVMPEVVLLSQERLLADVVDEWGNLVPADLVTIANDVKNKDKRVLYNDLIDYEDRVIWVEPAEGGNVIAEIIRRDHDFPFLPWVCLIGGSTMEEDEEHKRQPLLYSIYTTGAWENQNIIKSLYTSEAITHSGAPRYVEEGANQAETEYNYGDFLRSAKAPPGNTFEPLSPPMIDVALQQLDALFGIQMSKSTVSDVLSGGQAESGIAFAMYNLVVENALKSLKPAKELTEKALSSMLELILLHVHYSKMSLEGYSSGKKTGGDYLSLSWDEIDPQRIMVEVKLRPDIPIDQQSRINAAVMARQGLNYSIERALESIGETDPEGIIKQNLKERQLEHLVTLKQQEDVMRMQGEVNLEMQAKAAQIQQQQQAAAMEQQAAIQQQAQGGQMAQGLAAGQGGIIPGGNANNPGRGGLPPAMSNPNATREGVTGRTRAGQQVVE